MHNKGCDVEGDSRTFYTVQNSADAKRYLNIKKTRAPEPLSILQFKVYDSDLANMKIFDTRGLTDDELNNFFMQYARLYGGEPNHGFDYIINDTNLGVEHYFNKTIFDKLRFKKMEECDAGWKNINIYCLKEDGE